MAGTAPDTRVIHKSAAPLSHSSYGVRVCVCVFHLPAIAPAVVVALAARAAALAVFAAHRPARAACVRGAVPPATQDGGATPADEHLGRPSLVDCAWSVCGKNARSGHSSQERGLCACSGQRCQPVSQSCRQVARIVGPARELDLEPRAAPWLGAGSRTRPNSDSLLKVRSSSKCLH